LYILKMPYVNRKKNSYTNSSTNSSTNNTPTSTHNSMKQAVTYPQYYYNTPSISIFNSIMEGFALSSGQLLAYRLFGGPKINVEYTTSNLNINDNKVNSCVNTNKNCGEMLLEYEKCKNDYNCDFDKLDKLKNDYENCKKLN